jgi:hypothetical protein
MWRAGTERDTRQLLRKGDDFWPISFDKLMNKAALSAVPSAFAPTTMAGPVTG